MSLSDREATEVGYGQRLRDYLGYRSFDANARANLEEQLRSQLALGVLPEELKQQAEDFLRFWRVIPPASVQIADNDLARVSPLCFAHIIPNGTRNFERYIQGDNPACNTLP